MWARARQLFYIWTPEGNVPGDCQATLSILAGCGSPVFGVELHGGKLRRRKLVEPERE